MAAVQKNKIKPFVVKQGGRERYVPHVFFSMLNNKMVHVMTSAIVKNK